MMRKWKRRLHRTITQTLVMEGRRNIFPPWAIKSASIGLILLAWEMSSRLNYLPHSLLPAPSEVLSHLSAAGVSGKLFWSFGASLGRLLPGFVVGALSGVVLGTLCGYFYFLDATLGAPLKLFYGIPKLTLIPLAMLFLGVNRTLCVALIALTTCAEVAHITHFGVRRTDRALLDAALNLGATHSQILRHVVLPAILPYLLLGVDYGLLNAIRQTLLLETLFALPGIGHGIWSTTKTLAMKEYYLTLGILYCFFALISKAFRLFSTFMAPWCRLHPMEIE